MIEAHQLNQNNQEVDGTKEANSIENNNANNSHNSRTNGRRNYMWWLRMAIYTIFVLSGQTVAMILGRLYFEKGGNSKWIATFVSAIGFPVLIPLLIYSSKIKTQTLENGNKNAPSVLVLASIYISLGIFVAGDGLLYAVGLQYLPVSTYSLICATQIAFNAFFSYFLNSQKFTPFIINSLILLTISSALLVFNNDTDSDSKKVSKGKYMIGFVCTIAASAGYALVLSMTQLTFRKILKKTTLRVVLEMLIYEGLVSSCVILIGLFASGEWKDLSKEMNAFELGKWSYIMVLAWTAISWQVFSIGTIGLIFEFSSLFSNIIGTLGLPIIPVLAVFIFHDNMDGVKIISMLLAIWGFVSYVYQHYLDDLEPKVVSENMGSEISLIERG